MITLILCIFAALLAYWFLVFSRHPDKFPPGPGFPLPLLGNGLDIGSDLRQGFSLMRERYGDVFGLFVGPSRAVVIADYDIAQEAGGKLELAARPDLRGLGLFRGGRVPDGSGGMSAPGVIGSSGNTWAEQRRYSLHTLRDLGFGKSAMERWILEEVDELCKHFDKTSRGRPIAVQSELNISILSVLWTIVTGERLSYDDPKLRKLINMVTVALQETPKPFAILAQQFWWVAKLADLLGIFVFPKAISSLRNLAVSIVDSHKSSYQEDDLRDFTDHYLSEIKKKDAAPEQSSFKGEEGLKNLYNTIIDFFLAGSETTSNTLNFGLLYMIKHPDIQQKVQEELDRVTGRGRPPCVDDRPQTPYTDAVIHEIQRCSSVAPFGVAHAATKDTLVGGGKYLVPAGSIVFFYLERMMKDPAAFPDPEVFDPSRHLDKAGQFVANPRMQPFGTGRRRCLGESLARMSLYLYFTGILSRFCLEKASTDTVLDTDPVVGITLSPKQYEIRFVPRT